MWPRPASFWRRRAIPDGKNFPTVEVLFNTLQSHKAIAEAFQDMWKKNLNINVVLHNEEWKVYLDSHATDELCHWPRRLGRRLC